MKKALEDVKSFVTILFAIKSKEFPVPLFCKTP